MATTVSLPDAESPPKRTVRSALSALERWLERTGERLNPILVKECRQAMKARHFIGAFTLVLIACWAWSIWGLATVGPGAGYGAGSTGKHLFVGFYLILAFPLLVVVPHAAFRSLLDEREDRTFELLAITTLTPRQIVAGKLGAAIVQMLVYLSVVSPCLVFTYLLRGIDAPTIFLALAYTALASIGLSLVGILMGTLSSERAWQLLASVLMIGGLLLLFYGAMQLVVEGLLPNRFGIDDRQFWVGNATFFLLFLSYVALFFFAAAARLTFPSENRSTALRIVMFVQPTILLLCFVWLMRELPFSMSLMERLLAASAPFFALATVHWFLMGTLMTGEASRLSNRAKRALPQSFFGRMFLTWFNPGPGTGYVFAVVNLAGCLLIVIAAALYVDIRGRTGPVAVSRAMRADEFEISLLLFGYVTFYLGLGKLLHGFVRRFSRGGGIGLSFAVQVLLMLAGCLLPEVLDAMQRPHLFRYTLLYISNPFVTLGRVREYLGISWCTPELVVVSIAALVVFLMNAPSVVREIQQVRVAKPPRVAEEDASQIVAPPVATSPWD